jgi:hypothetical protein
MMQPTLSDLLRAVHVAGHDETFLARVVKNLGGGRPPFVFSTAAIGVPAAALEVAMLTSPPLNPGLDSQNVLVLAMLSASAIGTNGTQLIGRIRQGSGIGGTALTGTFTTTTAATNAMSMTLVAMDTLGAAAGQQYTLTVQVTNATATTSISNGIILAMALG